MIKRGFTLIELLVSLAITGALLASIMTLLSVMQSSRIKQQAVAEVEGQGQQVMALMLQTVRNASYITAPATTTSGTSLSVTTGLASTTPTLYDLSGGVLRSKEGSNAVLTLTNVQVQASALTVRNLSRATSSGSVQIAFTLSYATTSGKFDTSYSKTFMGAATLRRLQQ